ncbi:TIGR03668 family PPOX class F420-dependent oxidoreductase [Halegenticoccus tardaugens]|uniref:TIGR03668 family PPOX class F420-dependent oxidoreductase n=1 Tax=Halegenticoccus tardaugens TaxID=2071624 RepID=UPI00100B3C3A|nr:TIGR03668 family PPOX class F420-dependent oxidoreductase [Halegenticoccus tardaugens]
MSLSESERAFVDAARVGRMATADANGRPHVVPVCFALVSDILVTPIDEKPKVVGGVELRRVRDIDENPFVAVVVDRYSEDWEALRWVQIRGRADLLSPDEEGHADAIAKLRAKYDQYADHALEDRPLIRVVPGHTVSWRS